MVCVQPISVDHNYAYQTSIPLGVRVNPFEHSFKAPMAVMLTDHNSLRVDLELVDQRAICLHALIQGTREGRLWGQTYQPIEFETSTVTVNDQLSLDRPVTIMIVCCVDHLL